MQKIIQIYPCLLKLSRKQESVTDGQTLLLYPLTANTGGWGGGIITEDINLHFIPSIKQ